MTPNGEERPMDPFHNQERIQQAMRRAVQDAVRRHKLLGESIVIWRDGKVVIVPPEEINIDGFETNGSQAAE